MLRLAHLSDLHFGRVPPRIADRLLEAVSRLEPDLTVITGDMTQRSRSSQWRMARDFVDRLPGPVICVPGNHDAPLENVARRLLSPWRRYRRYIALDVAPTTRMRRSCPWSPTYCRTRLLMMSVSPIHSDSTDTSRSLPFSPS